MTKRQKLYVIKIVSDLGKWMFFIGLVMEAFEKSPHRSGIVIGMGAALFLLGALLEFRSYA